MKRCLNCDVPFSTVDKFCRACGQKIKISNVSFVNIIKDFFANLFNVENKLWKTLKDIWIPGLLTRYYLAGKRKSYYNPLRLFLVVLFSTYAVFIFEMNQTPLVSTLNNITIENQETSWKSAIEDKLDSLAVEHPSLVGDSLKEKLLYEESEAFTKDENKLSIEVTDSTNMTLQIPVGIILMDILLRPLQLKDTLTQSHVSTIDFFRISPSKLKSQFGQGDFKKEFALVQIQKLLKDLDSSFLYFIGNSSWAIVLLVLLMGLLFKLLYIRSNYAFVEHVVFHIYGQTRFLLLALFISLIVLIFPGIGLINVLGSLLVYIGGGLYLYLGMKAIYRQSHLKTALKWLLAVVSYIALVLVCFLIMFVVSAAMI